MYSVHIASQQRVLRLNHVRLVRLARATLASERVRAADISVALVDDAQIHQINRNFLGHDYPTDVVSFLLESQAPKPAAARGRPKRSSESPAVRRKSQAPSLKPPFRGAGKTLEGEIILSVEMAVTMAAECGWRPIDEVSLYLVHGLLHLCGYDDLTSGERSVMRRREVEVLAPWKIVPRYAD